jgi:hypothetical protein
MTWFPEPSYLMSAACDVWCGVSAPQQEQAQHQHPPLAK